jgi:hypothetical protein
VVSMSEPGQWTGSFTAGYLIFLTSVRTVVTYTRIRVSDVAENRE